EPVRGHCAPRSISPPRLDAPEQRARSHFRVEFIGSIQGGTYWRRTGLVMAIRFNPLNYAQPIVLGTGQATREFYQFLVNLFNAAGAGQTLGTASLQNIGANGPNVPLLNGTNEWSGPQTFDNGDLVLKGASTGTTLLEAGANAGD